MKKELCPEEVKEEELEMYFKKNGEETARELKQKEDNNMNIKQFALSDPVILPKEEEEVKEKKVKKQCKKTQMKKVIKKRRRRKLKSTEPRIELQENNNTVFKKKAIRRKVENGQGVTEQKLIQKKLADFMKPSKGEDVVT